MEKLKVVITDYAYQNLDAEKEEISKVNAEIFDYQCKTEDEVIAVAKDCDALIVQFCPITRKVINSLEHCRLIVRYAIGVDNIDIDAATEKGIYVANVPDYSIDEVSTHAAMLILAMSRKLNQTVSLVRGGKWNYSLLKPMYRTGNACLGLDGFGAIPKMVAGKMKNFGMKIISYDPYVTKEQMEQCGVRKVDFEELVETSDYLSVHCPLTEQTRASINAEVFRKMKKTAVLVNTARGSVVDEKALIEAIREKEIGGAAIDVLETEPIAMDNPLLHFDNVIVTPHIAWYTEESIHALQQKVGEEVARVLSGNAPKNLVNKSLR
ncbi:C-terminal binding protein [Caproiciproducens sp. R2]|uniref:C-terminal binding protein n=1 Tax=Caproiciproducens sp. R2 TaxID=3435187 RepID=UPI004033C7C5